MNIELKNKLNADYIFSLFQKNIKDWHNNGVTEKIIDEYSGIDKIYIKLLYHNYTLWHFEDKARVTNVKDSVIADIKRKIDKQNQLRNDTFEMIDDYIAEHIKDIKFKPDSYFNTETVGAAIDRLCILALKIYHMTEETERTDIDVEHINKCKNKLNVLLNQCEFLKQAINTLVEKIFNGEIKHSIYRQMKMYNDPTLNPELYKK